MYIHSTQGKGIGHSGRRGGGKLKKTRGQREDTIDEKTTRHTKKSVTKTV
jgi:hypothetical protein